MSDATRPMPSTTDLVDAIVARGEGSVTAVEGVTARFIGEPAAIVPVVLELLRRYDAEAKRRDEAARGDEDWLEPTSAAQWCRSAAGDLLRAWDLPWTPADAAALLGWVEAHADDDALAFFFPLNRVIKAAELACDGGPATPAMRPGLEAIRRCFPRPNKNERRWLDTVDRLLGESSDCPIAPGDPWADAAIADLASLDAAPRAAWHALLAHCVNGLGGEPAKNWQKAAPPLIDAVGRVEVARRAAAWLPLLSRNRADGKPARGNVRNAEILRGLAWACGLIAEAEPALATRDLAGALQAAAEAAYAKVPRSGRRCPKVGDACVWALARWPVYEGAMRLSAIVERVKNPLVAEHVTPRLAAMAASAGVSVTDLEEAALPDFGLVDGRRRDALGDAGAAELTLDGDEVRLAFFNDRGKAVKSPPAAVARGHAEAIAALKAEATDATRLLAAARARLERAWLPLRSWRLAELRARYLTHGLIGGVARRLIWSVGDVAVTFDADCTARDVAGKRVPLKDASTATLWHPIGRPVEEVRAWRERLAAMGVTQPFKQAHREVYALTDAERATGVYSNRFAAHIVRQHQLRAIAPQRGWAIGYFGGWDNGGATLPTLELPGERLRVEWNVDAAGGDDATLPGGGLAYLATDFVAFYPLTEDQRRRDERLPLDSIPPLVFSEVMRDVDLFVGVCSVGNDPAWQDGGRGGHGAYWQRYSFGELAESAKTRRDVLATLLPRLTKLRDRWSLGERFLSVRGRLRTYKIHLGSGNILMEPNDQYLCIVPGRSAARGEGLFLPFEGDAVLSIILSKAFLLAEDDRITDPTILSQINRT